MSEALDQARLLRLIEAGRALVGDLDLDGVLQRLLEAARDITGARYAAIGILNEDRSALERFLTSGISASERKAIGALPLGRGVLGALISDPRPLRVTDVAAHPLSYGFPAGHPPMKSFLGVPVLVRGEPFGNLYLTEKSGGEFSEADEQATVTLADWAGIAIANAHTVQFERLRQTLQAAESERRHWARELHDETLQTLAGLRVLLASALRRDDPPQTRLAVREGIEQIEEAIANLRSIITELRPAALDELGLRPAIETLAERQRAVHGFDVELRWSLPQAPARYDPDIETVTYRVVQEALTNAAKHARPRLVEIEIAQNNSELAIEVRDDGDGFDVDAAEMGFGISGMHERMKLVGGALEVMSTPGSGTRLSARIPVSPTAAEDTERASS